MTNEERKSYTEILTILSQMEPKYQKKIPSKLIDFFKEYCKKDYFPNITLSKPLKNQNLNKKTKTLLAILDFNFWCDTEEEKENLARQFIKNEMEHQNKLKEKYNTSDMFKNALRTENFKSMDDLKQTTSLIKPNSQKWYKKLFKKIFPFLNK